MRELHSLGFQDMSQCEEALRQSGGDIKGALSLLQRPLMEPFHQRIWLDQPEPPINPKHPDKQVRRLSVSWDVCCSGRFAFLPHVPPDVCCCFSEDVQAPAGAVRPAQLGALRARAVAAPGAGRELLPGGRGAGREGVSGPGVHPASAEHRVSRLSEHLPPQQGQSQGVGTAITGPSHRYMR